MGQAVHPSEIVSRLGITAPRRPPFGIIRSWLRRLTESSLRMRFKPDRRYCGKSAIGLMKRRPTLWGIWLFLTMKMTIKIALDTEDTDAKST
jgi:hypothetical protein